MTKILLGGLLLVVLTIAGCSFLKDGTQTPILGNNDGVDVNTSEVMIGDVHVMPRGINLEGRSLGEYLDAISDNDILIISEGVALDINGSTVQIEKEYVPFSRSLQQPMSLSTTELKSPYNSSDHIIRKQQDTVFSVHHHELKIVYDGETVWSGKRYELLKIFQQTEADLSSFLIPLSWISPSKLLFNEKSDGWGQSLGVWVFDVQSGKAEKLILPKGHVTEPLLSPNGKYILIGVKTVQKGDVDVPDEWYVYDLTKNKVISPPIPYLDGWYIEAEIGNTIEDVLGTSNTSRFSSASIQTSSTTQCGIPGAPVFKLPWPSTSWTYRVSRDGPVVQSDACPTTPGNSNSGATKVDGNSPTGHYCNRGAPIAYSACTNLIVGPFVSFAGGCPNSTCGHTRPAIDFGAGTNFSKVLASANGRAFRDHQDPGAGNFVRIFHFVPPNLWVQSQYMHLKDNSIPSCFPVYTASSLPSDGYFVEAGEVIGIEGLTGGQKYDHIHFELKDENGASHYPKFNDNASTPFTPKAEYSYISANVEDINACCTDVYEPNNTNAQAVNYDPGALFGGTGSHMLSYDLCMDASGDTDIGYVTCINQGQIIVDVQRMDLTGPVEIYTVDQSGNENILASGYTGTPGGLTFDACVPGNACQPVYVRVSSGIGPLPGPDAYTLNLIWSPFSCVPTLGNLVSGNGGNNPLGFTSLTAVSASVNPTSFCPGGSSVITMSGGNQYTVSGPGGIVCSPCNGSSVTVYPPTTPGSYDYIVSDYSDPCGGGEATVSITVNDAPIANAGPDLVSAGAGSPVPLQGSYTYTGGQSVSSAWLPGPHLGLTPTVSPTSTTTYTLYTGIPGCGTSDQMKVTVPGNGLVIIPSVSKVCSGSTITLTANGGNPPYTWVGGTIPQNTAGTSVTDNPVNPGTIIYSVTDNSGNGAVTSVIVHEIPTAEAGVDQNITTGQSTNLNGQGLYGSPPYTYQWTWPGGSSTQANPSVSPTSFTTYTLQVTDAEGCVSATDQMWIQPLSPPQHANLTFTGTNTVTQTGTSISGTVTVTNDGQVSTVVNPSIYVILHHQTQNFSIPLISENVPIGFAVNATQTETGSVPTNSFIPGKYFVSAVVDPSNYETETNENDNVYPFTQTFSLYPDLALANTSSSLSLAQVNDQLTITCDAINQGYVNAASSYHIRCFFSQDQILDAGDIDIGNVQYFGLMVNNPITNGSFTATVPSGTPNGQHYLIVMIDADDTNVELDEGNNVEIIPITIGCLTPTPDISFAFPLTRCAGLTDTVVTNTFTGNPNIWNDGQGNSDTTSFPASFPTYTTPGSYLFTLTIEDGCSTADTSVIITVVDTISLSAIITPSFSGTNGEIDLFVTGGQPSYTYEWSDGSLAEDLSGLAPDWYGVTVTDQANCLETDSFYVSATPFSVEWIGISANPLNEMDAKIELLGVFDQLNETVILERSRTGISWQELQKQTIDPILGEAYAVKFTDYGAALDTTVAYYRGKGIDSDGNVTYTSTASVRWTSEGFRILKIFPNPTRSTFKVQFHTNQMSPVVIDVYNSIGQLVVTQSLSDIGSGFGEIEFDATTWAEGVYFLYSTCGSAFSIDRITIR